MRTTPDQPGPVAGASSGEPVVPPCAVPPEDPPRAPVEGRQARRSNRRLRRRLSIGCVLLITACVVITVLIVGIARDRAPAPQVVPEGVAPRAGPAGAVTSAVPSLSVSSVFSRSVTPTIEQGATAPPGGNR